MENHPIPQDITGFQFKLIGSMTIKQFAYLVSGVILGWLVYIFPIPILIKIPLGVFFIVFAFLLAFVPFSGRPMDVMLINLLKALLSPTQFVYRKTGGDLKKVDLSKFKVKDMAPQIFQQSSVKTPRVIELTPPEDIGLKHVSFPFFHHSKNTEETHEEKKEEKKQNTVKEEDLKKEYEEAKEVSLQKQLELAEKQEKESEGKPSFEEAHAKVGFLSEELRKAMEEKQVLEQELIELRKKLMSTAPSTASTPEATPPPREAAPKTAISAKPGQVLTPEAPNVIMGIVKDARGNALPNMLVEVKDSEDNPVRAFKTNGLGQFASATPLSNGSYTIHLEDPKSIQKFDAVKFDATGELISPVEVISVDEREELRRTLFN